MKKALPTVPKGFIPLPASFYVPGAREVAPKLLGKWLLRRMPEGWAGGPIVEVEAYLRDDPACHASRGQTPRTTVMFGPPGVAYIYYIYGAHYCLNTVCLPKGQAEAVLIRAIEPKLAPTLMLARRNTSIENLTNGPGKLCAALEIDLKLNGANFADPSSLLVIASPPGKMQSSEDPSPICVSRRIGITKAADLPLRFYLQNSSHLSRKHGKTQM